MFRAIVCTAAMGALASAADAQVLSHQPIWGCWVPIVTYPPDHGLPRASRRPLPARDVKQMRAWRESQQLRQRKIDAIYRRGRILQGLK